MKTLIRDNDKKTLNVTPPKNLFKVSSDSPAVGIFPRLFMYTITDTFPYLNYAH